MNNLIVKINYINKRDVVEKILTVTIHSSLAIPLHTYSHTGPLQLSTLNTQLG